MASPEAGIKLADRQEIRGRGFGPAPPLQPASPIHQGQALRSQAQSWIAQRLPLIRIWDNSAQSWGVTNTKTVNRYLIVATCQRS